MRKLSLLLILTLFSAAQLLAQRTITGTVAGDDGKTLPAVTVLVNGDIKQAAQTDVDGKYSIKVPANGKFLRFSFVGMQSQDIAFSGADNVVNATLKNEASELEGVVVTALGMKKDQKALGYAVQSVKSDELTKSGSGSLAGAMQGKVAGIEITPSSGMPGASSKITIRGSRSFTGNNTPLYVVDGMPIASTADMTTGSSVTGADFANRAVDIDPNDIESINVLKGQAASALYGMRASNGVIIITTKSGKNAKGGKPQITFNTTVSFDQLISKPKIQTVYAQGAKGAFAHDAGSSWGSKIADLPKSLDYGGETDNKYTKNADGTYTHRPGLYYVPQREYAGLDPWVKPEVYDNIGKFFRLGTTFNNSLNIVKSFETGNYSISLGSSNTKGIVPSTGMDRYNFKFSGDLKLSKKWSTGISVNYVISTLSKQTGANNGIVATVFPAPPSYDLAGILSHYKGNPYKQNTYRSTSGFDGAYWATENNKFTEDLQRFFGNTFIKYSTNIAENQTLDVKYQIGNDAYTTNYKDLWGYGHSNKRGELEQYVYTVNELNSLFTVAYSIKFNDDLSLDALVGNEFINSKSLYNYGYGKDFNYTGFNHMSNLSFYTANNTENYNRTIGNFANVSLAYMNMLYLSATGRVDKVSSMPNGSRTFFYPSVSLGWLFTELQVLKNNIVTYGKLRASYAEVGQAGNYNPSYYVTPTFGGGFSSGSPISYPIDGITPYIPSSGVYDPNLKPQNTKSYEFGVDLEFLKGGFKS